MWAGIKSAASAVFEVLKESVERFGDDRGGRMAAAVSYRAMFALAPLLLIAIYALSLFFGDDAQARAELLANVERVAGEAVGSAVSDFLEATARSGDAAGIAGFGLLLWTGSSLFLELQQDLNDIFGMPKQQVPGLLRAARQRVIGFVWSLAVGALLIAVWLINAGWRFIGGLLPDSLEPLHRVVTLLAPVISFALLPLVFGLSFQTLSRIRVSWKAIWRGSVFTTVIFLGAAYGAGLYFRYGSANAAGVAGSIFVVLLLAYILSAVFLFGAEVTKVLEERWSNQRFAPEDLPHGVVGTPAPPVPGAAVTAFLLGLLVGWRRRR